MKSWKPEAIILAIGMLIMGYFIKNGLDTFAGKDRVVTVKGLAEMEVPANKVTWPLMYKEVGNDLPTLYNKINNTNQTIVTFLKQKASQSRKSVSMLPNLSTCRPTVIIVIRFNSVIILQLSSLLHPTKWNLSVI